MAAGAWLFHQPSAPRHGSSGAAVDVTSRVTLAAFGQSREAESLMPATFQPAGLPAPTGRHQAGRVSFELIDPNRAEIYSSNPQNRRELVVWGLVPGRPRPRRQARRLPARAMGAGRPAARPRRRRAVEPRRGERSSGRRAVELPGAGAVPERVPAAAAGRHRRGAGQPWLCRSWGQPHLRDRSDSLRRRPGRRAAGST